MPVTSRRPAANLRAPLVGIGVLAALCSGSLAARGAARAFPTAEGFGALVTGGRGGAVVHVTNLNDSGPGSLRDAISIGNRIVVFDVGGLIRIESQLVVKGDNITVAGQTAPGHGITVYGDGTSVSGRKNVVLRYLRFRQGIDSESGTKALNCTDGSNMIFDHLSVSWGRWDTLGITGDSSAITVQYSLLGESIDPQRFGGLVDSADQITLSHNLWLDNQSRSPKFKANGQYINNIVYNWGANGLGGGHSAADWYQDLINNFFIKGPSSTGGFATGYAATDRVYQTGNLVDSEPDGKLMGVPVVAADFRGDAPPTFEAAAHNSPQVPVTIESAMAAYTSVLASAGASLCRDAIDLRLLGHVTSLGTKGAIISDESVVGGQPPMMLETRSVDFDSDRDGMADAWETMRGLDPASAADGASDPDADGYSNLETYLHELTHVPPDSCGKVAPGSGSGGGDAGGAANGGSAVGGNATGGSGKSNDGGDAVGGKTFAGSNAVGGANTTGAVANAAGNDALPSGAGPAQSPDVPSQPVDAGGCGCRLAPRPHGSALAGLFLALSAARLRKIRASRRGAQPSRSTGR